jgi:hypothetical protein
LLPWLLLLGLLRLKFNRSFDAWYALVPVLLVFGIQSLDQLANMVPGGEWEIFIETARITAFGLAAMWLLLPVLKAGHWFIAFLKAVPVIWIVSGLTAVIEHGSVGLVDGKVFLFIFLSGVLGVALPLALVLAGWRCRDHYSPWGIVSWTTLWCLAGAVLALTPFALFAMLIAAETGDSPTFWEFLGAIGVCVGLMLGLLLPFLLLSFFNSFHRERFKAWLFPEGKPLAPPITAPAPQTEVAHESTIV